MSSAVIYAGIALGVAVIAGAMVYVTDAQQQNIPESAVPSSANLEGSFTTESGLGPQMNKEKWHSDPFADEAAQVKANAGL